MYSNNHNSNTRPETDPLAAAKDAGATLAMAAMAADAAAEAWDRFAHASADRLISMDGREYLDAAAARELHERLQMILYTVRHFSPHLDAESLRRYRTGIINIIRRGEPGPDNQSTTPAPSHE